MSNVEGGVPDETPADGPPIRASMNLDTSRAHGARIYDYILGGKDNYAADRAAGDATLQVWPGCAVSMRANRAFMHRVARHLATEKGIRQYLDIGTGIPTSPNLHEVVQDVAPDSRVVYADNDPIVLVHARALLTSSPEGRTAYVEADMREPEKIISARELLDTIDLSRPVGLMLIAVMQYIEDDEEAYRVVRRIVDTLPSGSYFAASFVTADFLPEVLAKKVWEAYRTNGEAFCWRTLAQAERFFEGLELEEPGVVQVHKWHPDQADVEHIDEADIGMYGALARKP